MSRHLDNLERLCTKMQRRYGPHDPLCQQLQAEVATRRTTEPAFSARHDWAACQRAQARNRNSEFSGDSSR